MTAKKWSDIRAQKFTPEELRQIDQEIESELLEMDLRPGDAEEILGYDEKGAFR